MTMAPSDADARFDRTIDRWFRDQLAMRPESATFFGIHDHDGDLASGGRDAVDEEVAFYRRTIDELSAIDPAELSADRALDRDLAIHQARLGIFWLTEYRPWAGSSGGAEHIGEALFPLFTRDFAPLRRPAREHRAPPRRRRRASWPRRASASPIRCGCGRRSTSSRRSACRPSSTRSWRRPAPRPATPRSPTGWRPRSTSAKAALDEHADWLRDDVLPRATAEWMAGRRAIRGDGPPPRARGRRRRDPGRRRGAARLREGGARRARRGDRSERIAGGGRGHREERPCRHVRRVARASTATAMDRARAFVVEHGIATPPDEDHLNVIETPSFIRHLIPFAAYYEPAKFDPSPVGTYIVTPPSSPEMMREHNRASISNTSVHEAYPGHHLQLSAAITNPSLVRLFSGAPEFSEGWAFYCERMMKERRVRRHAEGLVRRPHRCDLARDADHPRRPAPSRPHRLRRCRRSAGGRDRASSVRRRWPRSSATPPRRPTSSATCSGAT